MAIHNPGSTKACNVGARLLLFAVALLFAGSVHAVDLAWDANTGTAGAQDGAGTWSTANTNWLTGSANTSWNSTTPDSATFGAGGAGSYTVALGEPITAQALSFAAGPDYTLSGNTLTVASKTISVAGTATIASQLAGSGLTKNGVGTLVLTAANTYSGATVVNGGTLRLDGGDNRINPNTSFSFASGAGATLDLNDHNQEFRSWGPIRSGNTVDLGSGTLTLSAADLWSGSSIVGTGRFVKTSSALLTCGLDASYTGGTEINDGRLACYSGSNRLPTTGDVAVTGTGIYHLSFYAASNRVQTIDALSGDGTVWLGGAKLVVGNAGGSSTFTGTISDGPALDYRGDPYPATDEVVKTGSGTITFAGDNDYTGPTTVEQGTLAITHANALGTADAGASVADGATLRIEGNTTVADEALSLTGTGTLYSPSGTNAWGGDIAIQYLSSPSRKPNISVDTGSVLTVSGDISGPGPWIRTGGGTLILSGNSSQTQQVDMVSGVTVLQSNKALGNASYAHVSQNGPRLELEGGITVSNGLYIGNTTDAHTTVNFLNVSGDNTWSGYVRPHGGSHPYAVIGANAGSTLTITGQIQAYSSLIGTIKKVGDGTLVLARDNTYREPTFVNDGVLRIRDGAALGTTDQGTTVAAGAALEMEGGITVASEALTLYGDGVGSTGALRSLSGNNQWNAPITLAGTTIGVDSGSLTVSGTIDGSSGLTKVGGGTLVLTAANIYTGQTVVKGGTLQLDGGDNRINPSGRLDIPGYPGTGPATFDLNGQDQTFQGSSRVSHGGTVHLGGGGTLTLYSGDLWSGAVFTGSGTFAKDGTGTITFGSDNASYTGGTEIRNGRLACYGGSNRLPTTGDVAVTGGGVYHLNYYNDANRTQTIDALTGDGTVWLSGVSFVIGNGDGSGEFSGSITDGPANDGRGNPYPATGRVTKVGAGTITLSGDSSHTGPTTVETGVLNIQHGNALGSAAGGTTVATGAALEVQGSITVGAEALTLNGAGVGGMGALRSVGGDNTWNGTVAMENNTSIRVDPGSTLTLNGQMTSGYSAWNKRGEGTLILTAASTHGAYVNLPEGVLNLRHNEALGVDYAHVYGNAALEVQDNIRVTNILYIGNDSPTEPTVNFRSVSGDNEWAGIVYIHNTHPYAVIDVNPGSTLTVSGPIRPRNAAVGSLTKVGGGTLVFSNAANTYTGPTNVNEGTLLVDGSIASSSLTTVALGATLGGSGTVGDLTVFGTHSPGNSPDIQTVDGDYLLESSADLLIEILGTTPGATGHDQVRVDETGGDLDGLVTINDATLLVELLGGFAPTAGDEFVIIDNDGDDFVEGQFASLADGTYLFVAGSPMPLEISYFGGDGNDVVLTAVPEPATMVLLTLGVGGLLTRRRRR